jgi:hypothetical protein
MGRARQRRRVHHAGDERVIPQGWGLSALSLRLTRFDQFGEARKAEIIMHVADGRRRAAALALPAVDPRRAQPAAVRQHVVVIEALRDMQEALSS